MLAKNRIEDLPFVKNADFWSVSASGDWAADNATGREYADEFLLFIHVNEAPCYLGRVVAAMKGRIEAIEIGFLQRIADRAARP